MISMFCLADRRLLRLPEHGARVHGRDVQVRGAHARGLEPGGEEPGDGPGPVQNCHVHEEFETPKNDEVTK